MSPDDLRKAIIQLVEGLIPETAQVATVISVNKVKQTALCRLFDVDKTELFDVRLAADGSGNNDFVIYPQVNSTVLVATIQNSTNAHYIIKCSKVESIDLRGDNFGGIVKLAELEQNFEAVKDYLKNLETAIKNGFNAVGVSSAANGPAAAQSFYSAVQSLTLQFTNMENKEVKHG